MAQFARVDLGTPILETVGELGTDPEEQQVDPGIPGGETMALGLLLVRQVKRHSHRDARHGETLWAVSPLANRTVQVKIGPPVFVDAAGERLRG